MRPCRSPSHGCFALSGIDQYVFKAGVKIRERGVQLHNSFLESVIVVAATGWIVIDKVRCVQLIDHFRFTFLPCAFNPSARERVYVCFCSSRHRFLPNANRADHPGAHSIFRGTRSKTWNTTDGLLSRTVAYIDNTLFCEWNANGPSKFESHLGHTIVWQKFLTRARKAADNGDIKTISKTRPSNVTPFVLEDRWALDGLDQTTLQSLSKEARRKRVGVADVIHEAVELFVAKCEAEADLERKVIKFPMPLKTDSAMDHWFEFNKRGQLLIRRYNETLSVSAMALCSRTIRATHCEGPGSTGTQSGAVVMNQHGLQ
jgi:hypothetical protein